VTCLPSLPILKADFSKALTARGSDLEIAENGLHIRSHYSFLTTRTYKTKYLTSYENKERSEDQRPRL
jgi:hypothetical protein